MLYHVQAFDNARARLNELAGDSFTGKTDDQVARALVADNVVEFPAVVDGESKTDLVGNRVEYAHKILNPASMRFKPNGMLVTFGGYTRERLDGDRYIVSVLRESGMKPEQARAKHDERMRMFRQNMDLLAAQIKQENSNLAERLCDSSPNAARSARKRQSSGQECSEARRRASAPLKLGRSRNTEETARRAPDDGEYIVIRPKRRSPTPTVRATPM